MKAFHCANCGTRLHTFRKAIPSLGTIVDIIEYHECAEELIPYDPAADQIESHPVPIEGKQKFVLSLNDLLPPKRMEAMTETHKENYGSQNSSEPEKPVKLSSMTGTDNLRDRRFDAEEPVKSTAPSGVLNILREMQNSIPDHELKDSPESED